MRRQLLLCGWICLWLVPVVGGETAPPPAETGERTLIQLDLPASYGPWSLPGWPGTWRGGRRLPLADGTHTLKGKLGWVLTVEVMDGNVVPRRLKPGRHGRDLSGILSYGHRLLVPPPPGRRVVLDIPPAAGPYRLKELLPPAAGPRAVRLAPGTYRIRGEGWRLVLDLTEEGLTAKAEAPGPPQRATPPTVTVDGHVVRWQAPAAGDAAPPSPEAPAPTLRCRISRGRTSFRRDEILVAAVTAAGLTDPAARLRLRARRRSGTAAAEQAADEPEGERAVLLLDDAWPLDGSRATRSFSIAAGLLRPGRYSLSAEVVGQRASAPLHIRAHPAEQPTEASLVVVEASTAAAARASGGSVWLAPAPLAEAADGTVPLRRELDAATAAGVRGWPGAELPPAYLEHAADERVRAAVARANALLAQQARRFAVYEAFVQRGAAAGELPDEFLFQASRGAFLPEAAVGYFLEPRPTDAPWRVLAAGEEPLVFRAAELDPQRAAPWRRLWSAAAAARRRPREEAAYAWILAPPEGRPAPAVQVPEKTAYVCDLVTGEEMDLAPGATVTPAPGPAGARLLLFSPRRPGGVQVALYLERREHHAPYNLHYVAELLDEAGGLLPVAAPAELRLEHLPAADAAEAELLRAPLWRSFNGGELEGVIPLALNDPDGRIRLTVTTVLPGVGGAAAEPLRRRRRGTEGFIREHAPLEVEDRRIISGMVRRMRQPAIVIGRLAHRPAAERLAAAFRAHGIEAAIRLPNELAGRRYDLPLGPRRAQLPSVGPEDYIDRHLLLLGAPADNSLMAAVMDRWQLTPFTITENLPGPGRARLQCAWRPFSPHHDAVLLGAADEAGMALVLEHFLHRYLAP